MRKDDGDSDIPAWTQESATAWTRPIRGISGDLAAIFDSATSTAKLQLTNLHGDVVATTTTTSAAFSSTQESTEYGAPRGATGTRYAWLGGKQRAADTPAGLSMMGVRLYNPASGRFIQVDPVAGGSANAYDYAMQEPLSTFDLDGRAAEGHNGGNQRGWAWRACRGRNACEQKWWGITPTKYKKCPPGFKAAGETLGYRYIATTVDRVRKGKRKKAVESAAPGIATEMVGRNAGGAGRRLGGRLGRGLRRIAKLGTYPVGLAATGIDYLC